MFTDEAEKRLPGHILSIADIRGFERPWRVDDCPTLIAAARDANFVNLGGTFQIRLPDGGTREFSGLNVDVPSNIEDTQLPWSVLVEKSARLAMENFDLLLGEIDLFETARSIYGRTFWNRLFCKGYEDEVLRSSMYFVWVLEMENART